MKKLKIDQISTNKNQVMIITGVVLVLLLVLLVTLVIKDNRQDADQAHGHNEASRVAEANNYDKEKQQWSQPKSSEELKAAQELVGRVGTEEGSRFKTTDECLSNVSREQYAKDVEAIKSGSPQTKEQSSDLKAKQKACYQ